LIIFWLAVGFYLFFKVPASIYIYPENPKQGDTVFIRVESKADSVWGNFDSENIIFYKKGFLNEWIAFLGVDAVHESGDYEISVETSSGEKLAKQIKVYPADFSLEAAIAAPSANQTGITQNNAISNIRKNDNPALNKILDNYTDQPYFSLPFSSPLSSMEVGGFSFGRFINFSGNRIQHLGVDLRAPEGTNVYSVNDGKVAATLDLSNYGKTIIIDHGLDIFSLYLHLSEFKVSEGERIKRGQLIGLSGDTGYVTAPHLHFSMRVGGSRIDPVEFIDSSKKMNKNFLMADISNAILNIFKK